MVCCGLPLIGQKRPAPTLRVPRRPNGAQLRHLQVGEAGGGLKLCKGANIRQLRVPQGRMAGVIFGSFRTEAKHLARRRGYG